METDPTLSPSFNVTVEIITWFLLVVSVFAVVARLSTKWALTKKFSWDDFICLASLLCNFGAGAAVTVMVQNGLQNSETTISSEHLQTFQKGIYVTEILYIVTLCLAKVSIIVLLRIISPDTHHGALALALGVFIAAWGVLSTILAVVQCHSSPVYDFVDGHCFNRVAFWQSVAVLNIATDLCLVGLPIYIVTGLQMAWKKKLTVLSCFGARSFDIVATACQLAYTKELQSTNIALEIWPWILCLQVIQTVTIITSCIPYIRPLFEAFPSHMMVNDDISRHGAVSQYAKGNSGGATQKYILRDLSKNGSTPSEFSMPDFIQQGYENTTHIAYNPEDNPGDDAYSRRSSQRSQSRIIKATTTVETVWHDRAHEQA